MLEELWEGFWFLGAEDYFSVLYAIVGVLFYGGWVVVVEPVSVAFVAHFHVEVVRVVWKEVLVSECLVVLLDVRYEMVE